MPGGVVLGEFIGGWAGGHLADGAVAGVQAQQCGAIGVEIPGVVALDWLDLDHVIHTMALYYNAGFSP
jgi:hypothetical protein